MSTEYRYEGGGTTAADTHDPFVAVPVWVLLDLPDVSPRAKWLYVILLRYASMRDGARPRRKTMADLMGYSRPESVDPLIRELRDAGIVRVIERYGDNGARIESHYEVVKWGAPVPENGGDPHAVKRATPHAVKRATPARSTAEAPRAKPRNNNKNHYSKNQEVSIVGSAADDAPAVAPEEEREDVERLLDRLDARITENRLRPPSRTRANRDAMRRLLDRDGYKEHQVAYIIDWAQNHEFWIPNVLSAVKLRKQFQTLVAQSMQQYNRGRAETAIERQSGWDDMAANLTAKGVQ